MLNNYPLIPIRNTVVFPGTVVSLVIGRKFSVAAIEEAYNKKTPVIIAAQKTALEENEPSPDDIYKVGTLCSIERMEGNQSRGYQVVIRGISRFHIGEIRSSGEFLVAVGEYVSDAPIADQLRVHALLKNLKELAKEVLSYMTGTSTGPISGAIDEIQDPAYMTNLVATYLNISTSQKQGLLEDIVIERRIETLLSMLVKEREVLKIQKQIHKKISEQMSDAQRKALLREQLKTIREELGENEDRATSDLEKKIDDAEMPPEVLKIAQEELERLKTMPPQSAEYHVIRNYLELLAEMPWRKSTSDEIDLEEARRILDEDHYGLEEVKKRILDFLAVAKLKNDLRGPILCLLGPPGVGKTSLGQSIARVLGRKFIRSSLGGVRDEAEIRGHRRTYVGALPGRIIQAIRRTGVNNPLFMLDEIDKLGFSFQGDPASAMLEVLDPEQNRAFIDHYLDVPFDLSNVFFIATANIADTIPGPLLDRMEMIALAGYTTTEKRHIARRYLLPKQFKEHGLSEDQVVLADEVLDKIITSYTREAGVRELQRQIAGLCRWVARHIAEGEKPPFEVKAENLFDIMGPEKFFTEVSERIPRPGVATGLAWTPHGGDILFIEASLMKGSGSLILTGQLGDVMKESARIAMSFIRASAAQFKPDLDFEKYNIHVHVPSGAIPKDGPSAGVTILTAMTSLILGKTVDPKMAMTGEITLRGTVLPVGGIKEKILAAHRAGIEKVILPRRNEKDLLKIPEEVKSQLQFHLVDTSDEVLNLALALRLKSIPLAPPNENGQAKTA